MFWSISELRVRLAPRNWFRPSSKISLLTVPRRYFLCGSFVLFMFCVCHAFGSVYCCLVVTRRERTYLLALVCDAYCDFVTFTFGILGQVWWLYRFLILAVFLTLIMYQDPTNNKIVDFDSIIKIIQIINICFAFGLIKSRHPTINKTIAPDLIKKGIPQ